MRSAPYDTFIGRPINVIHAIRDLLPRGIALLALAAFATTPALAADKGLAYVTNQKGEVTVIDIATLDAVSEIDVGAEGPRGIGGTGDGKFLITANGDDGDISVIDRVAGKLVKR